VGIKRLFLASCERVFKGRLGGQLCGVGQGVVRRFLGVKLRKREGTE
jgi:hypothetical protein